MEGGCEVLQISVRSGCCTGGCEVVKCCEVHAVRCML